MSENDEKPWKKHESTIWIPEKGMILTGKYMGHEEIGSEMSNLHHFFVKKPGVSDEKEGVLAEKGEKIKVWGTKILDDHLLSIEPGTMVKLVYLGMRKPEKGRSYHDWEVYTCD